MFSKIFTILGLIWILRFSCSQHVWDNIGFKADFVGHSRTIPEQLKLTRTICKDSHDCESEDGNLLPIEVTKRKHKQTSLESTPMDELTFSYFPPFHHQQSRFCSCHHEKRFADLGPGYFPRYISDMICLPGGCAKNYVCQPKRLKLWAMRKRREDEEPGSEPIPKELREFWVGESIATTVDCECTP